MHGVAVGQSQTTAATHATANTAVAGMKNRGQFVMVDDVVNRPCHLVVRVVALYRGVELKAFDAVFFYQALCLARPHLAFVGVDAGKRNHHVAVGFGGIGDFFVGNTTAAELRFAVDGEHDQADLLFSVIGDCLVDRRSSVGAEELVGRAVVFLAIVIERVAATHLGMGVDVDGDEVFVVHAGFPVAWVSRVNPDQLVIRHNHNPNNRPMQADKPEAVLGNKHIVFHRLLLCH